MAVARPCHRAPQALWHCCAMVMDSAIITIYAESQLSWVGVVNTLAAFTPFGGQTLLSIFVVNWIICHNRSLYSIISFEHWNPL